MLVVILLGAAGTAFGIYENSLVYGTCYVEAGVEVTPQDFLNARTGKQLLPKTASRLIFMYPAAMR